MVFAVAVAVAHRPASNSWTENAVRSSQAATSTTARLGSARRQLA
ncbi:hypothetical protein SCANM63S_07930 [Streptomyces canarius]